MSVQVKTPTKSQFTGIELHCGNKRDPQADGVKKWKDDFNLNSKFSQPWNRKRRYSQSYRTREESGNPMRRKRIKSAYFEKPLPNRFLNGGSIDDPLNLNGLESTELGKQLNSVTPQSSPLPTPKRQSVQVRIPVNVTDPLNLNESINEESVATKVQKVSKKKKHRHRHKKDNSAVGPALFSPPKNVAKDKNLMEALRIDIEPEVQKVTCKTDKVVQPKPRPICDKIVSPVIRQAPHKKRRRTNSDGKPDPSAATSRSLLTSTSSSTTSPKKFRPPKQPSKGKGNKSMQGGHSKFVYGNYNRYYGYRNPSMEKDHRLECFSKEWFEGKCVLDIGCNVGHLTLAIAKEFNPSKVTGMDIDHKLVTAARKNIRFYLSSNTADVNKFPISNLLNYGPIEAPPIRQKGQTAFPHNVMFIQGNYVLEHEELLDIQREEYDVVLALSITKWIHFNWGDEGLKLFFRRIYKQLRPGGVFILEPQPWSSYKKKKKLTDEIFQNFQSIQLRPEQFTDYLLSQEVGFSTCKTVSVPMNKSKGFRRPILVFRKSQTVQNSPSLSETGHVTPPPRRNESMISMASCMSMATTTSMATSDQSSEYSSCSTCSCSSCRSESPTKRQEEVDEELTLTLSTATSSSLETKLEEAAVDKVKVKKLEEVTVDKVRRSGEVADMLSEVVTKAGSGSITKNVESEEATGQAVDNVHPEISKHDKDTVKSDVSISMDLDKPEVSKDVDIAKTEVLMEVDKVEPELSKCNDKNDNVELCVSREKGQGDSDVSTCNDKVESHTAKPVDNVESDTTSSSNKVETGNTEPSKQDESDSANQSERVESEISKPIDNAVVDITKPSDNVDVDITKPSDKVESEITEPGDKVESEVSKPTDKAMPEELDKTGAEVDTDKALTDKD